MSPTQDTLSGPTTPPEKPTAYRSPGSVVGGGVIALLAFAAAVDLLATSPRHWLGMAVLVAVAVVGFVFGVYPAAFADSRRLVIRNPFRTIVLPWPRVESIVMRLSIYVHAGDRYTVWAIPVSLRDRRRAERARMRAAAQEQRGGRSARLPGTFGGQPVHTEPQAPLADQAYQEMEDRRTNCLDAADDVDPASATWTRASFAALGLAALFVVLAAVLG
jgi:hypothetical protein